jgi:hypothetical protein
MDLIQSLRQWVQEVKRLGREVDQLLSSSSEVRNIEYYFVSLCYTLYLVLISSTDKEHNTIGRNTHICITGTIHQQLSINTEIQQFPYPHLLTPDDGHFGRNM